MTVMSGPSYAAWANHGSKFGNLTLADTVPPEMSHLIDPHWYQFPPINPLWYPMVGFVIGVLGFISVIGNGMVVYIFCSTKSLRTPSNMFVINLAFSDFLMMFTMSPPVIINSYYETWVFGPLMCQIYAFLGSLFGCGSIWTMTLIAFDRYNVIVKGLSGKPLSINGALLRILLIWIFSIFWTITPLFGWGRYVPEGNLTACGTDYLSKAIENTSYIFAYSIFVYYLPLFMIIYSYYFIIQAVAAHEKNMREQAKKMNVASLRSSENANTSTECKLAKVALMTISLWFMAWTPYLVINYTGILDAQKITPIFTIWGSIFAKANAVYNPIVYGISHPKYRVALFQRFPSLACANEQPVAADATSTVSGVTTVNDGEKASA